MTDVRLQQATIRQLQGIVREKDAVIAELVAALNSWLPSHSPSHSEGTFSRWQAHKKLLAKHTKETP